MKSLLHILFTLLALSSFSQVPASEIPPSPPRPEGVINPGDEIYTITEEVPEFPGGIVAMHDYLRSKLHYPPYARESGISGRTFLKFIVDKEGNIKELQVLKGLPGCKECDEEALAAVRSMPKWTPAKMNGKPVNCWYNLPVTFKLGKP